MRNGVSVLAAVGFAAAAVFADPVSVPFPPALDKLPLVEGSGRTSVDLRKGVTYHQRHFANYTGDGPLAVYVLAIDWTKVGDGFTLAVVPGRNGNRSRPSDLANGTNAIAAVNGVFHKMTDPYLAYYSRKIDGVESPCSNPGGDGCIAFNRGEMPYIGKFTKEVYGRYDNVLSADGMPRYDERERRMTPAERRKRRAPRTMAANITSNKVTIIVVADGRQSASTGLTYGEDRLFLEAWGADQLTHMDGGGSSVMVLKNAVTPGAEPHVRKGACAIMSVPSDGLPIHSTERRVSESLMLLDGSGNN